MKLPFHHIKHAHKTFDHFHQNLHHAFVLIVGAIIGMIRGASHIFTHTTALWQRGGFITSDFWGQNPSNANIRYAIFGDGTPGSTAYTRLWNSSCIATNVVSVSTIGLGGPLPGNTIYLLSPGTHTLTNNIDLNGDCIAFISTGNATINGNGNSIHVNGRNNIIIDNIKFNGNGSSSSIIISGSNNVTINNIKAYNYVNGIETSNSSNTSINNSDFYNNSSAGIIITQNNNTTINNCKSYNNFHGLVQGGLTGSINNSQFFNNNYGVLSFLTHVIIHNSFVSNNIYGIEAVASNIGIHNTVINNNSTGINAINLFPLVSNVIGYGTIKLFGNTDNFFIQSGSSFTLGSTPPITSRSAGQLDTGATMLNYDRFTNPQNGIGKRLLSGTNRTALRGIQTFDISKKPIRYIFGLNISQQSTPVWYNGSTIEKYGSDGADYFTTRYIAEPESTLSAGNQALVNQYFGSGSIFTQTRETNGCSLSAFQVVNLNPGIFSTTYNFQDHTIYVLTGGEYRSATTATNGFTFAGNCIALIGDNNTRFTKSSSVTTNLFYAKDKRNIIMDNIKIDGLYYGPNLHSPAVKTIINFDGITNNNTLNNTQISNSARYGIFLGLGSHHNTIINTQIFNNGIAGIYLYYTSNYNVINNTQVYNNKSYGIRFANGSIKNTINNFQAYNNMIGIYGDLTTKENIINRAAIYNNSDAGIYFKNSSNNSLNDVRIYNNNVGIRTLYASLGNKYYGNLSFFNNHSGNFDGTNGNDGSLSPGSIGLFAHAGKISTGTSMLGCTYATNPTLSGTTNNLLNSSCSNTGYNPLFVSPNNRHVNYMFGLNMYKQSIPVRYTIGSSSLTQITSQHDTTKYIAEIFPIYDDAPEGVSFAVSGTIELNTRYTTNIYTASVLNIQVPVSLSFMPSSASGNLIINGVATGLTGMVSNGNTIQIRLRSATGYNQTITGTIIIGSVSTDFILTTRDVSQTPTTGSFAFKNFTSMPVNTFTGSITTISGIETGVLASITFTPATTSGRLEIYSGGIMINSGTTGLLVHSGRQVKAIGRSSSGFAQTVTGHVTIGMGTGIFTITTMGLDITPPTAPTLTYPLTGEQLFFIMRQRTIATDTGSGLEGYIYEIAEDPNFLDIVNTGFIATVTGTIGSPNKDFDKTSDTFYRRMRARDREGNLSIWSNTGIFRAIDSDEWAFDDRENANLRTYYDSNEITIEGMRAGSVLWASVDSNGTLYENGNDQGTGAYVQNGDRLYVTVRSSNIHNKTTSTILTIANRELEFNVITKDEDEDEDGCTLSEDDKNIIQSIFDSLVDNYSDDENRYNEFLHTMQSMLKDEIDFTNDCNLEYLKNLIQNKLGIQQGIVNTGVHIAPNCKKYTISYDPATMTFTSPILVRVMYFANRDTLTRYIDSKNPGNCHINRYGVSSRVFTNNDPKKHIAPNGKIYSITIENGKYTSNNFIHKRYFNSIAELRAHIDKNNMPSEIRNHQVDTSFTPQTYIAPNGKDYKIYKTNRGYMSYKLMKVQYFSSLSKIQSHISKNNPR